MQRKLNEMLKDVLYRKRSVTFSFNLQQSSYLGGCKYPFG